MESVLNDPDQIPDFPSSHRATVLKNVSAAAVRPGTKKLGQCPSCCQKRTWSQVTVTWEPDENSPSSMPRFVARLKFEIQTKPSQSEAVSAAPKPKLQPPSLPPSLPHVNQSRSPASSGIRLPCHSTPSPSPPSHLGRPPFATLCCSRFTISPPLRWSGSS
jgi:hypothetical protein